MTVSTTPEAQAGTGRTTAETARRVGGGLLDPKMLWHSLPDAVKKSHDRLCTVSRTVELGTPIEDRIES